MKLMGYSVSPNNAKLNVSGKCLHLSQPDKEILSTSAEVSSDSPVLSRGFYWVKSHTTEGRQVGKWEVAFFNGEGWLTVGEEGQETDEYFSEIGEKVICKYQPELDK